MIAVGEHVITLGEKFPSSSQAGPTRLGRAAACSGYALAPASLRERAGRLARDTVDPVVNVAVVASGRGTRGLCGVAPPASSPLRVLRVVESRPP